MNFLDPALPARFWSKCMPEPTSGCWLWYGAQSSAGYGQLRRQSRTLYAHREAYKAKHGDVPTGLDLDHLCRTRCCVNPAHLEAVTHQENMRRSPLMHIPRGVAVNPRPRRTHCKCGHEYHRLASGQAKCAVCSRSYMRAWHAERKNRNAPASAL